METDLAIDPAQLEIALKVNGERTKEAAVAQALQEFIARHLQRRVLDLMRTLEWDKSFEHKAERSRPVVRHVYTGVWPLAL
jgi:hypothetical protein